MAGTALTVIAGLLEIVLFYAGVSDFDNAGYGSLPPGRYPRIPGLFLNFNMACNYLSVSLLIALGMVQVGWLSRRVALLLAATLTVAAAFTVSPGLGGLLLGVGSCYYILWRERRPTFARTALTLGIVAALLFFAATLVSPVHTGQQHVSIPLLRRTFEPSSRLLCWQSAHATWFAHPVFGEGSGLPVPCPVYLDASGKIQHLQDAHNVYLNIAATKGTFGLLAFVLIAWTVLQRIRPLRLDGSPVAVIATTLALCFIEAFLYQGLSSSFEHTRHLWIVAGMLAATCEMRRHDLAA
jgi:O-antigen ligase